MSTENKKAAPSEAMKTIETWKKELETPDWAFNVAKVIKGWGMGRELSETEFKTGIHDAHNQKINP